MLNRDSDARAIGQADKGVGFSVRGAMRATRTACLGTGAQRFVHDRLDGSCTAATLGAAAQTAIDLPRRARRTRTGHGIPDIMVREYVAGTNDHGRMAVSSVRAPFRYLRAPPDAKGKHPFSSYSKLRHRL